MNEEINKIIQSISDFYKLDNALKYYLDRYKAQILLNYITILQEENNMLKEKLKYTIPQVQHNQCVSKLAKEKHVLKEENEHKDKLIDIANAGISNLQKEKQKLNKIIDELEKLCNDEIKNGIKTDFGEEIVGISFKQTLTSYEFILNKLTELKEEVE